MAFTNGYNSIIGTGKQKPPSVAIKDWALPKEQVQQQNQGEQVYVRDYVKAKATASGVDISDDDIKYDDTDGSVYVKGMSIGKVDSINDSGMSKMGKSQIDAGLDSVFNNLGTTPSSQYGREQSFIKQGLDSNQNSIDYNKQYRDANYEARGQVIEHWSQDPLKRNQESWEEAQKIYGGVGKDEGLGVMASAGTGGNIDSTSLGAAERAEAVRMMEAFNRMLDVYNAQGAGLEAGASGYANDNLTFTQSEAIPTSQAIEGLRAVTDVDNQRKQTDATVSAMEADITGEIPLSIRNRSNPFVKTNDRGAYELINPDINYQSIVDELVKAGQGDSQLVKDLNDARILKTQAYPKFSQWASTVKDIGDNRTATKTAQDESIALEKEALANDREYQQAVLNMTERELQSAEKSTAIGALTSLYGAAMSAGDTDTASRVMGQLYSLLGV